MELNFITVVFCLVFYASTVLCDTSEGSECVSEDRLTGTCVDIRKCMQYVQILKEKNRPQICSYNNEIPIVCCTDCELVNDTRNVLVNRNGLHYFKTGGLAHDKCLEYVIDQPYPCHLWSGVQRYLDDEGECYSYSLTAVLAAASKRDTSSHPHMALLGYGNEMKKAQWLCAGSLISHQFILTAARCVFISSVGLLNYIAVGLGNPAYEWEKYHMSRAIAHPEYKSSFKYPDIALVESEKRIKFTHLISPACLNTGETVPEVAFTPGWTTKNHRQGMFDTLVTVILNQYSEAECTAFHPEHVELINGYNHTVQLCYGDQNYINDLCHLNIGSPLQVQSPFSSCTHTVIGVMSNGSPSSSSGVYTRISYFVPWIESIVWPSGTKNQLEN